MYGEDGEIEYGGSNDSKYSGTFSPEFVRNVYLEGQVSNTFKGLSKSDMFFGILKTFLVILKWLIGLIMRIGTIEII